MSMYETVFVLDPSLDDSRIQKEIEKVEELITSRKGKIVKTEKWGLRKFAYPIKKKVQGFYTLIHFEGDGNVPTELERSFGLNESCLRYLTVLSTEEAEEKKVEKKKEGVGSNSTRPE